MIRVTTGKLLLLNEQTGEAEQAGGAKYSSIPTSVETKVTDTIGVAPRISMQ